MIISAFYFTHVFSSIGTLFYSLLAEAITRQGELDSLNLVLHKFIGREKLKQDIRAFFNLLDPTRRMQMKLDNLMDDLPQTCQTMVVGCSFRPMLFANRQVMLFLLHTFPK